MNDNLEEIIRDIYGQWAAEQPQAAGEHPDEENIACFLEGKLSGKEEELFKAHILACKSCAEIIAAGLQLGETAQAEVPEELLVKIRDLLSFYPRDGVLEIVLKVKENILELLSTTGDVLVGQELMPAPLLRSRNIKDFKDEIDIFKEFQDIRVEIKIEKKAKDSFNVLVSVKEKRTAEPLKDIRISLISSDIELESYLAQKGKVVFEHLAIGKYTVELEETDKKLASIILDIRV